MQAVLIALALAALTAQPLEAEQRVRGVSNVEDLAPLPNSDWVLASSMLGGPQTSGALYGIDSKSGVVRKLYPLGSPGHSTLPGCAAEVATSKLAPHGIAFRETGPHTGILYVVNHGERESIETFEVAIQPVPRLRWTGCAISPPGNLGNSVASAPNGGFFVTTTPVITDPKAVDLDVDGHVLSWTPTAGWQTVPGVVVPSINGIVATSDGSRLYVASWSRGDIVEFRMQGGRAVKGHSAHLPFQTDNLRWDSDGSILVGGQQPPARAVMDCFFSNRTRCGIGSAIARLDGATLRVRCQRSIPFDGATVAAPVGREVWIGTLRGPDILRISNLELTGGHCE